MYIIDSFSKLICTNSFITPVTYVAQSKPFIIIQAKPSCMYRHKHVRLVRCNPHNDKLTEELIELSVSALITVAEV